MKYQLLIEAIAQRLRAGSGGRFRVKVGEIGEIDAGSLDETDRLAVVRFSSGKFPLHRGRASVRTLEGEAEIHLLVSVKAGQNTTALEEVETSLNSFVSEVYEIICDPSNTTFGLPMEEVSNVWVDRIKLGELRSGAVHTKTATFTVSFRVVEPVTGHNVAQPISVCGNITKVGLLGRRRKE